ncbi:hypothetical protein [Bradyrhizobium sp. URHD0069]|uniref:argonaute/piwi family protein n=1 Tax=Bradyrhizobium sp. URHD0069 TaxID=1380355 RepID=UPI000495329A|nr:hypothetical protein [Bradyrhizobium sp. URHD0069]
MSLKFELREFSPPLLEFGGPGEFSDPREGLRSGGPFDLRFGAARSDRVCVGIVGTAAMIDSALEWFRRAEGELLDEPSVTAYPAFAGFEVIFRAKLTIADHWTVKFDDREFAEALETANPSQRFDLVLSMYQSSIRRLSKLESTRPDVVVCCVSDEVLVKCRNVTKTLTREEKRAAEALKKRKASTQYDMFDEMAIDEAQPEDLLYRDFRRALKARAMKEQMPIQIATGGLFVDGRSGQGSATRAWNSSVGLYYKSGGIPWRLKTEGPETCFVGISFNHIKTTERHLVKSSIAQAFSSQGEAFALRGGDIEWTEEQGRAVHLTGEQAYQLGQDILSEYRDRAGGVPLRVVMHKSSKFSPEEIDGFRSALDDVPVVELINIMPTTFRLVRFGAYPPNRGTLCSVNDASSYLFTTGYMQELNTYPGPHIPAPVEIRSDRAIDIERVSKDILGLARMNWNTASITGGQPVTLRFARQVGGIMAEYGQATQERPLTSFRFYM